MSVARTHSIFMPSMMSVSSSVVCVLVLSFSCLSVVYLFSSLSYLFSDQHFLSNGNTSRKLTTAHLTIRVLHFTKKIGRCLVGPCFPLFETLCRFFSHRRLSSGVASLEWSSNASASYCLICSSVHPCLEKFVRYFASLLNHLTRIVWQ